jgi:hypothetical protein
MHSSRTPLLASFSILIDSPRITRHRLTAEMNKLND